MKVDFWQVDIFPLKKDIAIPGRIHQMLGDCYYLKIKKWFKKWFKSDLKRQEFCLFR